MSKVFTITEGLENLGAMSTGGQGSVYKGRRMGPVYTAIKLLPTPIHTESEDDRNFRSFRNEVSKLQKVNEQPNPNVVKILSSGITDSGSFPYIEMEYIEGPDLCELLKAPHDKIFMLKEAIRVADQLASALAHCHKVGVKHGDIKSNNVKYNIHTGNYVLLDFGLAILTDEQRRTSIRHAGAIEFMAPEQHEGKMLPQTDIYSYGIILYELLTGSVPFPLRGGGDAGRNAVMLAHIESPVPDLLDARRAALPDNWNDEKKAREMQVPQWLLKLIEKCLEKDPEKRFTDGTKLHEAIVTGSLIGSDSFDIAGGLSNAALRSENERLHNQLMQYQQAGPPPVPAEPIEDRSRVSLSKPYYYTIMILLVVFMGFSVYATFLKRQSNPTGQVKQDSTETKPDTSSGAPDYGSRFPADNAAEQDTTPVKRDSVVKKPVVTPPNPAPDSSGASEADTVLKSDQYTNYPQQDTDQ
ncbi:serine/threonine-protein kinase [Mucilaginibacter sp. AK015]|uniref:serine/threonine protein kinase n=1 Tax=Mucilaginibacter sp. AK015 TaxID=2723072 RepID=UPI00161CB460|nr:serine/threonine-protein kinase [Mucilaginibacter sp. AK015]MBB5394063.1 serine/threonine-protein kinase [Mucilaginibacter sp. AK015]